MTRELSEASSQLRMTRVANSEIGDNLLQQYGSSWYLSKKVIEKFSPSRIDGIDFRRESEIRFTYSTFLQDFGKRFQLPSVTIATAIIFCHRFYLHQSHARNDWRTMAPACFFLATKVEDTHVSLDHVVSVSYEMFYKKDPDTACRIKQKDVFEKQKALILIAERLLMSTIRFGFEVHHPYSPLNDALKKFGITGKDVRQYAQNCINDTLRTTLCLQYKPHYIAAGALYLALKFSGKEKDLPSGQGYSWWHEFDVAPKLLLDAIQEMRELLDYIKRLAATCVAGKPTQTPLLPKKAISKSPDSCVLSSSSQCSGGGGGGHRPADTIIFKTTRKMNHDIVPSSMAVKAELRSKARNLSSPDSVVEESQGPGEHMDQIKVKPRQAVDIKDYKKSGETVMKIEQNKESVRCHGFGDGLQQGTTGPVQVTSSKDSQGSNVCVDHSAMKLVQIEDAVSFRGPSASADRARSPDVLSELRMSPQQVADAVRCPGPGDGADQAKMPEQVAETDGLSKSGQPMNGSGMTPDQVADKARIPEQVAETEGLRGSSDRMSELRLNPEQVADAVRCPEPGDGADQARMPEQVAETDGPSKSGQPMNGSGMTPDRVADKVRTPEQVAETEGLRGSSDRMSELRLNPDQIADVFSCPGPDRGADEARISEQFTRGQSCQGSDQLIMKPERVADVVVSDGNDRAVLDLAKVQIVINCHGPGEGADQARTPEQFTHGQSYQGPHQGMDQSMMKPEQVSDIGCSHGNGEAVDNAMVPVQVTTNVPDLPSVKPEQVAATKVYEGCGNANRVTATKVYEGCGNANRVTAEQRLEMIKASVKRRKMEKETLSRFEKVSPANISRKPEKVTIGLDSLDMDRIRALLKKRKRERESSERKEATDNCGDDDWIEKELESGIELRGDSTIG